MTSKYLSINRNLIIPLGTIELSAVRSQGAGGQNVNKVATAIQLKFDIKQSTLPQELKEHLLNLNDRRISWEGVLTIKSQQHRTQKQNRAHAINRLKKLIEHCLIPVKKRKATKPTKASQNRRILNKTKRSELKKNRGRVNKDF